MKLIFAFAILLGTVTAYADETSQVTCTLKQGYLNGDVLYTITVDTTSKVPFFINPTQFSVNGASFSGVAYNGVVQTEVLVDDNKITSTAGLESSVSLMRKSHQPLRLNCKIN